MSFKHYLFAQNQLLKLAICCLLLLFICTSRAQNRKLKFEYLTPNDGLSQAAVTKITEDKNGFMWFGTRNGLNRYDGYNFVKYYNDPKDTTSISGDLIECLYLDNSKNLWIGTNNGFSLYDSKRDAFLNFRHHKSFPRIFVGLSINSIFEDSFGNFWIGSYGAGIAKWDRKTNTYTVYSNDPDNKNSISSNLIHSIIEDNDHNLWIATDQNGLDMFSPKTESFTHFVNDPKDPQSISGNLIWTLGIDKNGTIWIGTLGGGLNSLIKNASGKYKFTAYKPKTNDIRRFKILSMYIESESGIWLGTENGGLDYFDFSNKTFTNYTYNEKEINGLNSSSVQSVFSDRTGNLWVGTYTGGVNVDKKYKKQIDSYRKIPGNPNSLSFDAVTSFYFNEADKTLWVGTDGGGLNIIDTKSNKYKIFNQDNSELQSDAVLAICKDANNRIWVGGWECGLNLYSPASGTFINILQKQYNLPNNNIFDIVADSKGQIWITFGGRGFAVFNYTTKTIKVYNTENLAIPSNWIFDIDIDKTGNILLGHANGFSIFDPIKERIQNYRHLEDYSNSLNHDFINTIMVSDDSTIWIGTNSGLNRFDPKRQKFKHISKFDGLPNNSVVGILEDNNHDIWISTNDGITKYSLHDNSLRNYNLSDGLQGKGFTRSSCYKSPDGKLYFGGPNGFNVFHPDSLYDNPVNPKIVITGLSIFNKPVKAGEKGSPLKKSIMETDTLWLSYKHSVISIEFAALDFTAPSENQYKYMLVGFDYNWTRTGPLRTATYTNLDPGTYTLKIQASNNDNKWSPDEKTLTIIVAPPFWKTWWFNSLILICIISVILLYIRMRTTRLKAQNKLLEERVRERTFELEETNTLLEEKQEEINNQTEELLSQRDSLEDFNLKLQEQNLKIEEQNKELDRHRNELEILVEQRTRELEQALYKSEESDRLKSSFLANMSHEIRTPMNAIIGFTQMLTDDELTQEQKDEFIDIIAKSGESLLYLIDDILDLSKIQANQMIFQKSQIGLTAFLNDIKKSLTIEAEKKGIDLKLNASRLEPEITIETDVFRLKQVFNNLITNSLKFTQQGYVEFGIDKIDGHITFFVKDTGIGIPKETGNSIFERFTKLENKKNKLYSGTGLGLAISKSIIELLGGQIWYESEENVQTVFYFTHPLKNVLDNTDNNNLSNRNTNKLPDLTGKTVVIVEDEEYNYKLLLSYLLKCKARVVWSKNGKEVIDYVENNHADMILMDIKMPLVSGIEASIHIKNKKPEIPIVAQTAFAFENEIKDLQKAGMNEYLVKPIKLNDLTKVLWKYFDK